MSAVWAGVARCRVGRVAIGRRGVYRRWSCAGSTQTRRPAERLCQVARVVTDDGPMTPCGFGPDTVESLLSEAALPAWRRRAVVAGLLCLLLLGCSGEETETSRSSSTTTAARTRPSQTTTIVSTIGDGDESRPIFDSALGTERRECVDIDRIVDDLGGQEGALERAPVEVRSGEIVAGDFSVVVNSWERISDEGIAKIYWVPLDPDVARESPLQIVVEPLSVTGDSETLVVGGPDSQPAFYAGGYIWPSGTPFPGPGRYRLNVTAPEHWGCFEVTV